MRHLPTEAFHLYKNNYIYDICTSLLIIPGTVVGVGVGLTRDCSTLMVAQYFKRRRELVEIFIVSGSGLGIAVMSTFIKGAIR